MRLDVNNNRAARKYTRIELAKRVLWRLAHPLFRLSPRPLWGWRRLLLRAFGAKIGLRTHIYPTAMISMPWNLNIADDVTIGAVTLYALGPIMIGERVTISQGAHLCAGTHDLADPARRLLKPPVVVERDSWVCADAFVGPGVVIGEGAVLGARAVAMKDIPAGMVAAGNPARVIKPVPRNSDNNLRG